MVGITTRTEKGTVGDIGLTAEQQQAVSHINPELVHIGYNVVARQKEETFLQAWKVHWKAGVWSCFLTASLLMEGYDTGLLNSLFGQPQFRDRFGKLMPTGLYEVPSDYQAGLQSITRVGQIFGLCIVGFAQERFGSKKTYLAAMAAMVATIFMVVFAKDLNMLLGAEFLCGIPWGMFQTLATAYAAEICPVKLRGYLAALASLGWGGGSFLGAGVLRICLTINGNWAWRLPFALQWVFPPVLGIAVCFAPESPWWLVRKGRPEEAAKMVRRLAPKDFYGHNEVEGYVAYMQHTDALEKLEAKKGSWAEMFKGTNRRRTEIMIGVWLVQNWNGSQITSLAVQFLRQAGLSTQMAFNFTMITDALGVVGVAVSWILLSYMGRRPIYLIGIFTEAFCLLPIGVIGCITNPNNAMLRSLGGLLTLISFIFHFSLGPVCYSIAGELPSSRLRSRTIVLGRALYLVSAIIVQQINVRMVNADAWNWRAKSAFFWLGTNFLCFAWSFFRLPETAGFSFADLEILFTNKVAARKFTKYKIHDEAAEGDWAAKQGGNPEHMEEKEEVGDVPDRNGAKATAALPSLT